LTLLTVLATVASSPMVQHRDNNSKFIGVLTQQLSTESTKLIKLIKVLVSQTVTHIVWLNLVL